jgi:uracil-DNA glycosylase family 4
MDARDQLRRFLEQRREMGETELILDSMTVDEVMKLIGAPHQARASARPAAPTPAPSRREPMPQSSAITPQSDDWREVMRAADAASAKAPARVPEVVAPAVVDAAPVPPPPVSSPVPAPSRISGVDAPLGLVVGSSERDMFNPFASLNSLGEIAETVAKCTRCPLYATALNPVPGQGNPNAELVCVGEAPGATEDQQGLAFVGQAGQLLTKILEAIDLKREDVFICNVLKHRPPGNRNPLPLEVEACAPYLVRQLELIRPKVIVAWGTFAAHTLLNTKGSLGSLRGAVHRYYGIPTIVTYHPAALLRNPGWKKFTWEDVKLARRILDSARAHA